MVDLAEPRSAVLIFRPVSMIFHAEAVNDVGTFLNVRNWIDVVVVHDVSCVVVDSHACVVNFTNDLGTRFACTCRSTMLLHHDQHSVVPSDRSELLESFDPEFTTTTFRMSECQNLPDARRRCLFDPLSQHANPVICFRINGREHHDWLKAEVTALHSQILRLLRRCVGRHDGNPLSAFRFPVRRSPCD